MSYNGRHWQPNHRYSTLVTYALASLYSFVQIDSKYI